MTHLFDFLLKSGASEVLNVILLALLAILGYLSTRKKREAEVEGEVLSRESVLKLIKERRSITPKDFSGAIMSTVDIEYLLEAGNWAPTHHKTEPWRYIVISGSDNILDYLDFIEDFYTSHRDELPGEDLEKFDNAFTNQKALLPANVSHMLVICMKRQALPGKLLPEWEEMCATACSVQNMHLALTALAGWGGFWSSHTWCKHARDSTKFKEYLGLDAADRVLGAFMVGRVAEGKKFRSTRSHWSNKEHNSLNLFQF